MRFESLISTLFMTLFAVGFAGCSDSKNQATTPVPTPVPGYLVDGSLTQGLSLNIETRQRGVSAMLNRVYTPSAGGFMSCTIEPGRRLNIVAGKQTTRPSELVSLNIPNFPYSSFYSAQFRASGPGAMRTNLQAIAPATCTHQVNFVVNGVGGHVSGSYNCVSVTSTRTALDVGGLISAIGDRLGNRQDDGDDEDHRGNHDHNGNGSDDHHNLPFSNLRTIVATGNYACDISFP